MHFPKYWARGEWTGMGASGEEWRQWAWDHSDVSQDEARTRANAKAQRLGQSAIQSSRTNPRGYPYADRPVREAVLRTIDSVDAQAAAAITRTSYGSEVLNTEGLMFIDIDLPVAKNDVGLFSLIKRLFSGQPAAGGPTPSPGEIKIAALRQWQSGNPSWAFRVYRTHSGLRYLVTSGWQDPLADRTHAVFASLDCDERYRQLCKIQKSFRARLTPKPWRCGCDNPPVRFPYEDSQRETLMNRWVASYQKASEPYATCQFLSSVGSSAPAPEIASLIAEHDQRTKATSGLPLA